MKNKTYINSNEIKEIVLSYESESKVYEWFDREPIKNKTILFGLITTGVIEAIPAGWGGPRYSDEAITESWESIRVDRDGLRPRLLYKARVTLYFGYRHSTTSYFNNNEEAELFADEIASVSGCDFLTK